MNPTYQITTIVDLLSVPIDRRQACLRDIETGLATLELAFGERAAEGLVMPFNWIDDGTSDVMIRDSNTGELALKVSVTPDAGG